MIYINSKKKLKKGKIKEILNSYKTIITISFIVNIILILFSYYILSSNKVYSFSSKSDYVKISDGLILFNTDINIINGSNIEYINKKDYDIKEYKIGYYTMENKTLIEIVTISEELDDSIKLSSLINNFSYFNIVEKNRSSVYFTKHKKTLIGKGLYFVIEAKTMSDEEIFEKVKINMTKISKY